MAQSTAPVAVKGLHVSDGLEATLWAAEPLVVNPTNIDIDERGRVWYLEAVNYRRQLKGLPDNRKEGDRIVILEDSDGDGRADRKKVFHQDPSLRSPLGIAVLGDKVFISQSPSLIVYTKDSQDRVINKETFLTGWGGLDHDHGLHAVTFGPDGRLYFNSGDQGFDATGPDGRRLVSSPQGPYYAGTALRVNMDGAGFTVIAHNFRNPYELAVDSFGGIWQSDNDDDGNAWTRFNYVLPGGNYGYWGPGGRKWREDRGSHFHQENPGVVPNIARLGAGSPCGLLIYEGTLLPERFRHQPLHAEAGKRQVNAYLIEGAGAGYALQTVSAVSSPDTWFRPSDVAVAPDGSVFIADWYDASVGGHNMQDIQRGRIYRLAPKGHKPAPAKLDLASAGGLAEALASPAQSVRYLGWTGLRGKGAEALPALTSLWQGTNIVARARSLWLLGALEGGQGYVDAALADPDERIRMLGLRVLQLNRPNDFLMRSKPLWNDASARVRRELAALLRDYPAGQSADAIVSLARQLDGNDRWYLEALGLALQGKESLLFARLREAFPGDWDDRFGKLLWRLRPPEGFAYLTAAAANASLPPESRKLAAEALSEYNTAEAVEAVSRLIADPATPDAVRVAALERASQRLFSEWVDHRNAPSVVEAIGKALDTGVLRRPALQLAEALEEDRYAPALAKLALDESLDEDLRVMAVQSLGRTRAAEYVPSLQGLSRRAGPLPIRQAALRAIAAAKPAGWENQFQQILISTQPNEIRSEALRAMVQSRNGAERVLALERAQELPAELRNLASNLLNASRDPVIRREAGKVLPPPVSRARTRLPPVRALVARQGDAAAGRRVYYSKTGPDCASCHALETGKPTVGPNLAAIGDKLGKEGMVDAILNPSAGVAHEYVTWILDTKSQGQVIGILAEDTGQRVVVKTETGEEIRLKPSEVTGRRKSSMSMMPEDLVTRMTEQELVDLLEFLTTLKESRTQASAR